MRSQCSYIQMICTLTSGVSSESSPSGSVQNPFLKDIFDDLYPMYTNTVSSQQQCAADENKVTESEEVMDGHLMYIFGIVVRDLRECGGAGVHHPVHKLTSSASSSAGSAASLAHVPSAYSLLFESVRMYPFNW
jgi:hypothetical protein